MKNDIGDYFQQATKYIRGQLPRGRSGGEFLSLPDKSYPDCPSFSLPPPQKQNGPGLWETILVISAFKWPLPLSIRKWRLRPRWFFAGQEFSLVLPENMAKELIATFISMLAILLKTWLWPPWDWVSAPVRWPLSTMKKLISFWASTAKEKVSSICR